MIHAIWSAMWPNIFAPSAWTLIGIGASHTLLKRHHNKRFDEMKQHIAQPQGFVTFDHKLTDADMEDIKTRFRQITKRTGNDSQRS